MRPAISIIVTAHNEGAELSSTLDSIRSQTSEPFEIILVDDGSTDGSTAQLVGRDLQVIRHEERIGVAYSRNAACRIARGEVFAFLDAHQRLSPGCLDQCAAVAREQCAIVWPDVQGLIYRGWTGHGAQLRFSADQGQFTASWICNPPVEQITPITAMVTPGYVMTRQVYERVSWSQQLRGWGASEPAIVIKAFFQGIPLLHLCGPIAYHLFRKEFPYQTVREEVMQNHALVTRICFSDEAWRLYWRPVFELQLSALMLSKLDSPEIEAERRAFALHKLRADESFWNEFLGTPSPVNCQR